MEKYRVKGKITTIKSAGLRKTGTVASNGTAVKKSDLPPLSMSSYVFTGKQLQKKQKQVRSTIQEAESLMALELGHTPQKKKRRILKIITQ